MHLTRKKAKIVRGAISEWEKENAISLEEGQKLRDTISVVPVDWKKAAGYAFFLAVASIVISVSAVLSDRFLMEFLARIFRAPAIIKTLFFAFLAFVFLFSGFRRIKNKPEKIFTNESLVFLGVISIAASVGFLGIAIGNESGHFSILLLLAAVLYGVIGLASSSKQVWVFALISLGAWFGAETGYISGWGAYYFGMNFPLRFVLFGFILTSAGFILEYQANDPSRGIMDRLTVFALPTRVMGYIYLFMALWILSIFGNYGDLHSWRSASHAELFHWSLIFGLIALVCIFHGLKYDDAISRGFGISFLVINLYTRFFEFFWGSIHKAAFFAVLGISFWFIGRYAEKIWSMGKDQ